MDFEHIKNHTPEATRDQCFKLAVMKIEKLVEEFNFFLSQQGKVAATRSKVDRYRNGFLNLSVGYENGPSQEFKDFVVTL